MLLIVGILAAVLLADRVGRIRLQIIGFIGCAAGLGLATLVAAGGRAARTHPAVRRLHAVQLRDQRRAQRADLPAGRRGLSDGDPRQGRGFAAAFAKVGAVLMAFFFPVLLADAGVNFLLSVLIASSLLGAWITWQFRIETTGIKPGRRCR